jgi:hypothetical protein
MLRYLTPCFVQSAVLGASDVEAAADVYDGEDRGALARPLAFGLDPALLGFSAIGLVMAGLGYLIRGKHTEDRTPARSSSNPLEIGAAAVFAILFVLISLVSAWARTHYGATGIYLLSAIVGVSDIDPFVLSPAKHGAGQMPLYVAVNAILIASASQRSAQGRLCGGFRRPPCKRGLSGGPCPTCLARPWQRCLASKLLNALRDLKRHDPLATVALLQLIESRERVHRSCIRFGCGLDWRSD